MPKGNSYRRGNTGHILPSWNDTAPKKAIVDAEHKREPWGVPLAYTEGFIARRLAADETTGDWTLGLSFDGSGLPYLTPWRAEGGAHHHRSKT
jgi:hypothetical protein